MRIWCPASPSPLFLRQPPPHILPRSRNVSVSAGEKNVSGLGHSLIAALNTNPTPKNLNNQQQEDEEDRQLSGSDVLWALQRAAATRNKAKKRVVSSSSPPSPTRRKEMDPDYTNVKPLIVNTEWSAQLDDLHKRLQELSDMV